MTPPSPSASLPSPLGGIEPKNATQVLEQEQPPDAVNAYQNPWHTIFDRGDMQRLGKKQEYRRVFGPLATFGFISMYLHLGVHPCLRLRRTDQRGLWRSGVGIHLHRFRVRVRRYHDGGNDIYGAHVGWTVSLDI